MFTSSRFVSFALVVGWWSCWSAGASAQVEPAHPAPPPALDAPAPTPVTPAPVAPARAPAPVQYAPIAQQPVYAQPAYGYGSPWQYAPPVEVPPDVRYERVTRSRKGLWMPGLVLLGIGWIANFAIATPAANLVSDDRDPADEEDAWAWSLAPIVGPIAQLAIGAPHPAIALTMGLFQIGGLALFIAGLVSKEEVEVPVHGMRLGSVSVDAGFRPVAGGGMLEVAITHM